LAPANLRIARQDTRLGIAAKVLHRLAVVVELVALKPAVDHQLWFESEPWSRTAPFWSPELATTYFHWL